MLGHARKDHQKTGGGLDIKVVEHLTSHQQASTALKAQDPNKAKFVHLDKSRGELWFENPIGQGMD
jgi:hypothetical protein